MPLITSPVVSPETPTPEVPPPVQVPEIGYAAITYVDPTGRRWPMTDISRDVFALADGVSGLGATPYKLTTDTQPRGGSRIRHVHAESRAIIWPVLVKGSDHSDFVERWREMGLAFTRTLREGPGRLEVARPDGSMRWIDVVYSEGWEGRGQAATGITWDSAVVTLLCEDPYWIAAEALSVHRESGTPEDYQVPFPTVSSSQVLGATTVTNPGDIQVWPTWVVSGPATAITMTHEATGESFTLTMSATPHGPLLAGQTVTVSTDPPAVTSGTGENLFGGLDWPTAELWGLAPGDNAVTFQLDGSGPGSAVDLTYYPRFETA
ncbi:phage tail domain-containing protein [Streptomyces sp. UH6]|uniref:phage tail domain-containing protein n=1 Tax=Streptomyces sp. UH6 TaxID=2748379 RepID=UPI0015D4B0B8|nr:phage tail domain-containing protein [Streptomyces sp. UH6]NYV72991.1 phage tail family protein [Streptomyces sp. UH6]